MTKLIVLALVFTALVAFASAYTTIVTTTIQDENQSSPQQCQQELQWQQLNECENYLQQNQGLDQCCNELQKINEGCKCAAVQQVYQQAKLRQQQQQQQGQSYGSQATLEKLRRRAQNLPSKCYFQQQQCPIGSFIATTTTTIIEDNLSRGSEQCRQQIQGQRFQQCQWYIQQAQQSGSPRLMMITNKQGQQQLQQERQQCCNELKMVQTECQCEAMQEIYKQAKEQQQQWSQQGGRRGGQQQQQQQMQGVRSIVENLRDQCNLQVQQCKIPSAMF